MCSLPEFAQNHKPQVQIALPGQAAAMAKVLVARQLLRETAAALRRTPVAKSFNIGVVATMISGMQDQTFGFAVAYSSRDAGSANR